MTLNIFMRMFGMQKIILFVLFFGLLSGCGLKSVKTNSVPGTEGAAPSARFIDKGDGIITDTGSGLIWLKKANISEKLLTWQEAIDFCKTLNVAGYGDWRLPSKDEIGSLITGLPANNDWRPYLEKNGFSNVQDFYWTASEYSVDRSNAWSVPVALGYVGIFDKTHTCYVWPVRGTMSQ
jgi:hypothetical protein